MKVDISAPGAAFLTLAQDPTNIAVLDANFFIPPDRSRLGCHTHAPYPFPEYRDIWIEPMLSVFPNLAVHEAVVEELVEEAPAEYVHSCLTAPTPRLQLLSDAGLSPEEDAVRHAKELLIAPATRYDPTLDNKDDRGEVKSLAHMGTMGYLYFCSNDAKALRLIEEAPQLGTSLDELGTVHFYEGIYYLLKAGRSDRDALRDLYRYLYRSTRREKTENPTWGDFCAGMDALYPDLFP